MLKLVSVYLLNTLIVFMSFNEFIVGFFGASHIEIIASISGFICIFLLIHRNIWNWFFGLIQVTLFVWVFYQNKLYSDTILNIIYIGLQFYGWWNWLQHKTDDQDVVIEQTSLQNFIRLILCCSINTLILGYMMNNYTDASFAYADAFIAVTSLVAQWLLTRRQLLNWIFWIVVDIVAIIIYFKKGLYPTSVLYITFLIMSVMGQYSWLKQYQHQVDTIDD